MTNQTWSWQYYGCLNVGPTLPTYPGQYCQWVYNGQTSVCYPATYYNGGYQYYNPYTTYGYYPRSYSGAWFSIRL
jgi:hypothetical protein